MFYNALEVCPNCADAHLELGSLLELRGKFDQAFTEYQEAYEDKPDLRQARYQLGRALLLRKRPAAAIALLSQTLSPDDDDTPRFMYNLGLACAEAGDRDNAASYLEHAGGRARSRGTGAI